MKNLLPLFFVIFSMLACKNSTSISSTVADNPAALHKALQDVRPGDKIVMADGEWNDVEIKVTNSGTEDNPIKLVAETPGKVLIQGRSNLQLGGDYIIVEGLYFTNGSTPSRSVINFSVEDTVANHCIVSNCVIKDYNQAQRNHQDLWVQFHGRHNQMDHCYLSGKSNKGPTVRVDLKGNQNINNHHKIINNHFGPRPPKGGPSAETIQIGNSFTSMCPSYTLIADNLFDQCNGEVEVISSKTNFNEFRNNVFYKSEGSLVTRHGNYCTIDGNYFIGDEKSSNIGGVRLIGTGHTVTNNYFYKLRGKEFRSPLAVMNGIPKSPLNRYIQVTDVIVAHNSWINCEQPWQFGVGSNVSMKDVLPASEIRSARPIRTIVANNLIHNTTGDEMPIVAHDKLDGISFKSNVVNNQGVAFEKPVGVELRSFELKEHGDMVFSPASGFPDDEIYDGFGFEAFDKDIFGASRADNNSIGSFAASVGAAPDILDRSKYGSDWFDPSMEKQSVVTHAINPTQDLLTIIRSAAEGDIIKLAAGEYVINSSLKIDKAISIMGTGGQVSLKYMGDAETPMFELNPKAKLELKDVHLMGTGDQYAFASLKEGMSSLYNLIIENCLVENFDYILKAYKYSFSEFIFLRNSNFRNCNNGLVLSEELDDRGEYNAENIFIDDCIFERVSANVIDYYRGGYDESTVGGNLVITNSSFSSCGGSERSGTLIKTYGIINVDLSDNVFKNNQVKRIALLWGAKNNSHQKNIISNSGEIVVEENLKLKTFY